ncbi:SLOB protein kinase [Phytophthora cinnamomi]|uniref:SLOB protein kinase n=1 Tax=Phytophthora cinnamomi TaxID=4785 RepID=UPI00355A65CF|nr:SLOB protein kinase [Phytophthora cinnamomi]
MASPSSFNATLAVLLAAKYCRQYPLFRWREEALPAMGRRAEKYCFRVDMLNLQQESCGEMLLALLPAQLSLLDFQKENTLYKLKALLVTLKHPYILPVLDIYYSKEKKALVVVQPFTPSGSIKDRIYQVDNPAKPYDVKYRLENAHPLPLNEIAKYSRQILEALDGLRSKGLVCDHLRSTNVVVDDGNARLAEIYTPLLAIDRYKDSRELTVSREQHMDIDLLLFGQILYEMATGMELLSPLPEEGVLEMLAPEIAEVLVAIFYEPESLAQPEQAPLPVEAENMGAEFDDSASVSTSTVSSRNKKHLFLVDVEQMLEDFPLFAAARDVPPIRTLFSGFRLDSGMKSTIKYSMRINASRSQAHIVHYNDQEALLRARQRAERRVYEEKEKQQQRIQQLTPSRNPASKGNAYSSKTIPSRRKTYRADSFRKHAQRTLSRPGSSKSNASSSSA